MDIAKIGRYIAEKRKRARLTQRQLADKLGRSDKSVSKWERGICLPSDNGRDVLLTTGAFIYQ